MKGQISVEHIVLLGIVLVILVPGLYIFYNNTLELNNEFDNLIIRSSGEDLIDTVSLVKILGNSGKKTVTLDLPENFNNLTIIGNNTIVITYEDKYGISDLVFVTDIHIQDATNGPSIEDIVPGRNKISVQNYEGIICLSHQGGDCSNSCGNRILESSLGEVCDTSEFGGLTCQDFGRSGGTLVCSSNCSSIDTTACFGCGTTGDVCLDRNFIDSGANYLNSDYVIATFGDSVSASPDIGHSYELWMGANCGYDGMYKLKAGGAIQLSTSELNISDGTYIITATIKRDPGSTYANTGIQCDGTLHNIPQISSTTLYTNIECDLDSSSDIRIIGQGTDYIYLESLVFTKKCLSASCENTFDSGHQCIVQGYIPGTWNPFVSDLITFGDGPQKNGSHLEWPRDTVNDGRYNVQFWDIPEGYQDYCTETIYFDEYYYNHDPTFIIENFDAYLDPLNPAGIYDLSLNIFWDNSTEQTEFDIVCGNSPTVRITKPLSAEGPLSVMMTEQGIECDFDGIDDTITITNPTDTLGRVEFEGFRLKKRCI